MTPRSSATIDPSSPWAWRPSRTPWYRWVAGRLADWRPQSALALDEAGLRRELERAIASEADWLLHPCFNALTLGGGEDRLQRDFQLAVWVAAQGGEDCGGVHVPDPVWAWSRDGGFAVAPGNYSLAELGATVAAAEWPCPIALDVWCHSIGFALPDTWAAMEIHSEEQQRQLRGEIALFMRTVSAAARIFPECLDWVKSVTRVAVPLYSDTHAVFRSGSDDTLPGMIYLDLMGGDLQIMEALVHESAHRHLFLAEGAGPLVDPAHQGRYASPLRPEPRPLRGILLAYHAIAYICAFYVEAVRAGVGATAYWEREVPTMRQKLDESEETLAFHAAFLTESGGAFFARTREVAEYGRQ